ncbi:hypothetical protein Cgig2_022815 [Carnegiea gigantea]|uniref:pectinesterase n=1 Tax=Carnegiea gigantea TaxID=171969 RepID=A0A9Q1KM82_9CARY|nr:hypothetical protein Cgig2_022815 [Carnegiea gigantea]
MNEQDPSKVFYTITVSNSDDGNFSAIQKAIDSIPPDNDKWVKIVLMPGTYKEQVTITETQCIVLEGQDRSTTMITFDAHNDTEQSITFDVYAHNFVARKITFQNSYNLPGGSTSITPAVAFRGTGEKQAFFYCGFQGYQDTLWNNIGSYYFESCYIEGAVDFIWGEGASFYEKCSINVTGDGFITAQGKTTASERSGFVFKSCDVSGLAKTLLGRAYKAFATVVFIESYFGDIIKPEGWNIWKQASHQTDVTFVEYKCKGAGADTSGRVPWMKTLTDANLLLLLFAFFFIFQTTCILAAKDPIQCKTNDRDPSKVFYTITISKSGRGNFTTVKKAIESIPRGNDKWVKIFVMPGTYKEQIQIKETQCIFLEGKDRRMTTITFDAHNDTDQSITFDAYAHNFVAKGITFKNSYNLPGGSTSIAPAVAFRALGDKQAFFYCGFEGYQDTLWDSTGRHYFESCYIEGAIDFIWGAGASFYEKCSIKVIGDGFITAQGKHQSDQISGFVFNTCSVSGIGKALLGRAYNAFATVIFTKSVFTDIIEPEGWDIWKQTGHEKDVTFVERNCRGPGADTSKRALLRKNFPDVSKRIKDAVNATPSGNDQWIRIYVDSGTYWEQVKIWSDQECIVLEGHSREDTIIAFENEKEDFREDKQVKQAVAISVYGDKSAFYNCGFIGYQDTLWDVQGRHFFKDSYIEGAIDFIWGDGQSIYEDCSVNVTGDGYITAQGRDSPSDSGGFVFIRGSIYGNGSTYLGRAYASHSTVIFRQTFLSNVVNPLGWDAWDYTGQESKFTYTEINCTGEGADTSKRVAWEKTLSASEASKYTTELFIDHDNWISQLP